MKSIAFLLLAVAMSVNLRSAQFELYVKDYSKTYSSAEEERYRLTVFSSNLKKIEKHNARHLPWTLGVNKFADVTEEEFLYKFCGCAKDPKGRYGRITPIYGDAPEKVDWREKGAVTEVKNQGACGSCWAFSTVATVESAHFIATGELLSLSEQHLVDCARIPKYQAFGCAGGWPWSVIDFVKDHGLCKEEDYPYTGTSDFCSDSRCTVAVTSKDKVQLPQNDEVSLANAVAINPVSATLDAGSFQLYKGGIITECSENVSHAILIVGYDVDKEKNIPYWIIKNSWGADWGEKGYVRVEKDAGGLGRCGITYSSVYPIM